MNNYKIFIDIKSSVAVTNVFCVKFNGIYFFPFSDASCNPFSDSLWEIIFYKEYSKNIMDKILVPADKIKHFARKHLNMVDRVNLQFKEFYKLVKYITQNNSIAKDMTIMNNYQVFLGTKTNKIAVRCIKINDIHFQIFDGEQPIWKPLSRSWIEISFPREYNNYVSLDKIIIPSNKIKITAFQCMAFPKSIDLAFKEFHNLLKQIVHKN